MGLVLLRIAVASHAVSFGFNFLLYKDVARTLAWSIGSVSVLLGGTILIGFLTPIAGIVCSSGYLALGLSQLLSADSNRPSDLSNFYVVVISISLILLGPGAFSMDARLFGRREIILP